MFNEVIIVPLIHCATSGNFSTELKSVELFKCSMR